MRLKCPYHTCPLFSILSWISPFISIFIFILSIGMCKNFEILRSLLRASISRAWFCFFITSKTSELYRALLSTIVRYILRFVLFFRTLLHYKPFSTLDSFPSVIYSITDILTVLSCYKIYIRVI